MLLVKQSISLLLEVLAMLAQAMAVIAVLQATVLIAVLGAILLLIVWEVLIQIKGLDLVLKL